MSGDSPASILFDINGNPIDASHPLHVTVENQPSSVSVSNFPATQDVHVTNIPHVVVDSGSLTATVDTTGLASTSKQDQQTSELQAIRTAVQAPLHTVVDNPVSVSGLQSSLTSIDGKLTTPAIRALTSSDVVTVANPTSVAGLATEATVAAAKLDLDAIKTATQSLDSKTTDHVYTQTLSVLNDQLVVPLAGVANLSLTITSSGYAGTLSFFWSPDGTLENAMFGRLGGSTSSVSGTSLTSGNFRFASQIAQEARFRLTALTSGTISLVVRTTSVPQNLPTEIVQVALSSTPLPSGASTSALQTTGNTSLSNIDGKLPAALVGGRLSVDGSGVTQPVSIASVVHVDDNASTLSVDDGGASITIDSPQLPASLDGSGNLKVAVQGGISTSISSGTVGISTLSGGPGVPAGGTASNLSSTDFSVAGRHALDTVILGANLQGPVTSTDSGGGPGSGGRSMMDVILRDATGAAAALGQTTKANSLPVVLPSDQTINTRVLSNGTDSIAVTGNVNVTGINTLGQKTMANSTPVVLASDQAAIPVTGSFSAGMPGDVLSTGSFTANGQTLVTADLAGYASVGCYMNATGVLTIQFEGTSDGTTWFAVTGTPVDHPTLAPASNMTSSNFSVQFWRGNVGTIKTFRLRVSSFSSGTCAVRITAQPYAPEGVVVTQALPAGSNIIGAVSVSGAVATYTSTDTTGNASLNSVNANQSVSTTHSLGTIARLTLTSYTGTLVPEYCVDTSGTTFALGWWQNPTTGALSQSLSLSAFTGTIAMAMVLPSGCYTARVRCTAFTSGTCQAAMFGTGLAGNIPRTFQPGTRQTLTISFLGTTIANANNLRQSLLISNQSGGDLYLNIDGTTPSSSNYMIKITTGQDRILRAEEIGHGAITAAAASSGNTYVQEIS